MGERRAAIERLEEAGEANDDSKKLLSKLRP
jgi:hypothetical protein